MATMMEDKVDVCNSLSMFNTVGQELVDVFAAHGFTLENAEEAVGCVGLPSKERLTKIQMEKACKKLGLGEELSIFLTKFQENYKQEKERCKQSDKKNKRFFIKLKPALGLLRGEFTDGCDLLEDILDYFGVDSAEDVVKASECSAIFFRQQNKVEIDPINLKAWLRRGELDFQRFIVPAFDEKGLLQWIKEGKWKSHLQDVSYFKNLPEILLHFGIVLVYVPFLPKTVYGAVRWFDGKPLVQISDRNQDLAGCWFTLFHELGHVFYHRNEDVLETNLNESKTEKSQKEKEANKFANEHLFNGDALRKRAYGAKFSRREITALELGQQFNVDELFAAYWLRLAQYKPFNQKKIHIDFNY